MIVYAKKDDKEKIKSLFDICFYEDPLFNEWFFENIFDYKETILYKEKNSVLAMLQMMKYKHSKLGMMTYIYGACTSPEYRKKGLMAKLINFSFEEDIKNNINCSFLIPANNQLFDYYEKFGYKPAFFTEDTTENIFYIETNLKIEKINEDFCSEILKIYNMALKNKSHILRDLQYIKTQINMFYNFGGYVYLLKENENPLGFCFVCFANDTEIPLVQEILTVDNNKYLQPFKSLIFSELGKNKIRFMTLGDKKALGVMKCHKLDYYDKGYMNLMFN